MRKFSTKNRKDSYSEAKYQFSQQEEEIMRQINMGYTDAWSISEKTGMLITSVRRALTNMTDAGILEESGSKYHQGTDRNVTTYKPFKTIQKSLF